MKIILFGLKIFVTLTWIIPLSGTIHFSSGVAFSCFTIVVGVIWTALWYEFSSITLQVFSAVIWIGGTDIVWPVTLPQQWVVSSSWATRLLEQSFIFTLNELVAGTIERGNVVELTDIFGKIPAVSISRRF